MAGPLTFAFDDGSEPDRLLLGGKGAGLVEMVGLGLPVPAGFVIGTPCGRAYLEAERLPAALDGELRERMEALEESCGRRFGAPDAPMLVSVRSGAPVSMPGMMDTILNVGLTVDSTEGLARETSGEFAWSCFQRLLDGFGVTVRGIPAERVQEVLLDQDPSPAAAPDRCSALLELIEAESGKPFPDPEAQLREAIAAVFASWMTPRAQAYRRFKKIDDSLGTAVVVQLMLFGNRGKDSGSGVAFTRDPTTGERRPYGDFLFGAQGEDVVDGSVDTLPLASLGERLPDVMAELEQTFEILEWHTRDMCDIEFTIEEGRLGLLQTRSGQRSGRAAVRIAVEMVDEGLISPVEAVARVSEEQLRGARAPAFADALPDGDVIARGLAAAPGAAVGRAAFDPNRAIALQQKGEEVILLRPITSPADVPGFIAATGVVTGRGGRASHAAVVARGLGRPAVCGVGDLVPARDSASAVLNGQALAEGEWISVDGDRGLVARGAIAPTATTSDVWLARFEAWLAQTGGEGRDDD